MTPIANLLARCLDHRSLPSRLPLLVLAWSMLMLGCVDAEGRRPGTGGAVMTRSHGDTTVDMTGDTRPPSVRSCSELSGWLARNTDVLTQRVEHDDGTITLQYRPAECLACQERPAWSFQDPAFKIRVEQLSHAEMYLFRVARAGASEEAGSLWDLPGEELRDRFVRLAGEDTTRCSFVHVEAMPSFARYRTAIVAFDVPNGTGHRTVVLRDREQLAGSDLAFTFNALERYRTAITDSLTNRRS